MKNRWRWLVAAVVATLVVCFGLYKVSRAPCFVLVGEVLCRVETARPVVALTFDDGPTPLGVDALLPELARYNARATFFLVGEGIEAHPELPGRLRAAGHELGNHSYSHRRMVLHTPGFYAREIDRTEALLAPAGPSSGLFRPPYSKKLIGLPLALRARGLKMIMWDVEDPAVRDPAEYARLVVERARPGSIILIHPMYPSGAPARQALPLILEGLRRKGLTSVTVGELLQERE